MTQETPFLRLGTQEDVPQLTALLREFYDTSIYSGGDYDEGKVLELATDFVQGDQREKVTILLVDGNSVVGFFLGITSEVFFNRKKAGYELAWFVKPKYRNYKNCRLMLSAYQEWCSILGCESSHIASLTTQYDKLYKRLGYTPVEHSYKRELWPLQLPQS